MRNIYMKRMEGRFLSKTLLFLLFSVFLTRYVNGQVIVSSTAGSLTSATYSTFKAAIDNINNGTHQGSIVIKVHSNTTETASSRLDSSGVPTGASYTSVTIMPADTATVPKIIDLGLSAAVVFDLNGADNVTVDGRPLGLGSSRLLTFRHSNPNLSASSGVIRAINGVANSNFYYLNSTCLTGAATVASINFSLSTSASRMGNRNIRIDNCIITGGISGVSIAGTVANFMDSIYFTHNTVINAAATSFSLNGTKNAWVDSNVFTHNASLSGWNVNGMFITPNVDGVNYRITRNVISNLGSLSAATLFGVVLSPSILSPLNIPQITFVNNSVSLVANTTTLTNIRCLQFQGTTAPAIINCYYNTFRIGGSGTATTGQPSTVGVVKTNTATATVFNFTNNIAVNSRTGSGNQHVGYWNQSPTSGTLVSDYNSYFGGPNFSLAWITTFHGTEAGFKAVALPNEQNSTFGPIGFVNNSQPDLAKGFYAARNITANPMPSITTDIYGTARSTSEPYRGAYEGGVLDTADAGMVFMYTYGKIPIGTIDTVRAIVRNYGKQALTGLRIKLTGSLQPFEDSITINLPAFSADTIIHLATYTPSVLGFDTLKAIITNDQTSANNTISWIRENTLNALTYTQTTLPRSGNVGTNPEGEIIAKFYTPVPNYVNQVNVNFSNPNFNGPFPFQIVIYEDSVLAPGPKFEALWVSPSQNTVNGVFNLSIPSVPVNGNFYIGVRQTSVNNIGFAFQNESPIRNNTFYFRQGAGYRTLPWDDFAVNPANQFRFMIEPRLKINDDLGVIDVVSPGSGCADLGVHPVKFRIQNLGLLPQNFASNNLTLSGWVRKPSGNQINFGPVTVNNGFLISDDHIDVDLVTNFNFDSVGTYTFKAWTSSGIDNNRINDTLPELQRIVLTVNNAPYIQNFDTATVIPSGWVTNRFVLGTGTGTNGTKSIRVNINGSGTFAANAALATPRVSGVISSTVMRFDYRITNFTGGAATTLLNTDSIKILVSTDCGNTFSQVRLINGANHNPSASYITNTLPVGAFFSGNDVVIKFVFDWFGTTNDAIIDIDNVRFVDADNDMGVTKINSPCRSIIQNSASFAPEVTVQNFGLMSQANVDVNFSITGPLTYTGNVTIPFIAAGAVSVLNASSLFNPTTAGAYTLKVWTALSNDGDRTNDTITIPFNVTNIDLGNASVNGLSFTSGAVKINNSPAFNPSSEITLEAWINRSTAATRRSIISKDSSFFFIQYSLALNDTNGLEFNVLTTGGYYSIVSNQAVPTGFNHVAATFNGSRIVLYINGKIVRDTVLSAGTIIPHSYDLAIGNLTTQNAAFGGSIDEVKIWNVARTESEIRSGLHTRLPNSSNINLVAYYRMDEGAGNTFITDASGNCNSGVFGTLSPTWVATQIPLGTPAVVSSTIYFDGFHMFTGMDINMNMSGVTGFDTVYIHKFAGLPLGTSPAAVPGGISSVYPAYWILHKYGNGSFSTSLSTIEFTLMPGSLSSGVVNSDLRLFNRPETSTAGWTALNPSASNVSFGTQTVQYALGNGAFNTQLTIGGNNNPLPVKLVEFKGTSSKADAILTWSTSSESNSKMFVVERSVDGKTFEQIDEVKAAGNSNRLSKYTYPDRGIFKTQKAVYYRLKQVDLDGSFVLTKTILVESGNSLTEKVMVYPNPVSSQLNLEISLLANAPASVTITDLTGKLVKTVNVQLAEGFNNVSVDDITELKSGIYLVSVNVSGRNIYNDKIVKVQ